jgi:predicted phage tail protein
MNLRIVALAAILGIALLAGSNLVPSALSPVSTASASCDIYLDGHCTNACFIVGGVVQKVDPKQPWYCFE